MEKVQIRQFRNTSSSQAFTLFQCICQLPVQCYCFYSSSFMNTNLYRVIQEERSILWEVIVSMTMSKEVHMNVCKILNGYRDNAV
jgi:hypothetical protein